MTDTTRYAAELSAARANLDRVIARAGLSLAHRDAILASVGDAIRAATDLARAEMRECARSDDRVIRGAEAALEDGSLVRAIRSLGC